MPSPLLALSKVMTTTTAYGFLLVGVGVAIILASSIFIMLLPSLPPNQSAFGTFPGENGKIAFSGILEDNRWEIYVMNADGSTQTRLTNSPGHDDFPDWGPATDTEPPPPPFPTPGQVIDELISTIQNLDDDNVPQSVKTDIIAALEEVSSILNDNNPNNDESEACDELGAFINQQVNAAERDGTLTADQANDLRTQAEDVRNMLGC
jgi:hypothetical protein